VVSAAILAPLALVCLWVGGTAFQVLIVLASGGLAVEWVQLCRQRVTGISGGIVVLGVLAASVCAALGYALAGLGVVGGATGLAFAIAARGGGDFRGPSTLWLPLGLPYVGLCAIALIWLRANPSAGRSNLLFLLLLVWASDIGAYLAGRLLGGPRLAPSISPGKTWSGAAGGLAAAVAAGLACAFMVQPPDSPLRVICLAAGLGIIAQAGDLAESRIKRHFGVKDSGHLIPGHGGLFDRLDAVLAVAPVAAVLALFAGPGVALWQ
jgi:phosphatidate cytidylyltransferase